MIDERTVDWRSLTPRGRIVLRRVALPLSTGLSHAEVARALGLTPGKVADYMRELRDELTGAVHACAGGCGEAVADSRGKTCGAKECRKAAQAASRSAA